MAEKRCSKCGKEFGCCAEGAGCWCENYIIQEETLQQLKKEYDNCLCEECLKKYAELVDGE